MMMSKWWNILLIPVALGLSPVLAAPFSIQSSNDRISLLELYTSEGCSSCPPADRWLSTLKEDTRLWRQVVPVAFHVDYWDYIGWPDRFASRVYGQRQRLYAGQRLVRTVYTPGFVLNGREWRQWFSGRDLELERGIKVGRLGLTVEGRHADVKFMPTPSLHGRLEVHLVVLGFGLSSEVKGGENRGRLLQHDFVVLGYERLLLKKRDDHYGGRIKMPKARFEAPGTALAAWVSQTNDPRPLQAVGGWMVGPN